MQQDHIQYLSKSGHDVFHVSTKEESKYSGLTLIIFECRNCGTKFEVLQFPKFYTYHVYEELFSYEGTPNCAEMTIRDVIE